MTSADIRNYAIAVFFVIASIGVGILVWNARIGIHSINDALADFKEYVHSEKDTLENPRNAKAIEAATQVGGVVKGTLQLVNTTTIPRLNKTIDALTGATTDLATFTRHTDSQVNSTVLPATTAMVDSLRDELLALGKLQEKFGLTVDQATEAIKMASEKSGKTVDELNTMLASADPRIQSALDQTVDTLKNTNQVVLDIHHTTEQMPHTMAQIDKTATNISKFSKVSIIAGIISSLANGFLPGLLH